MNVSNTPTKLLPKEVVNSNDIINPTTQHIVTAFFLSKPNLSLSDKIIGSIIEIFDVIPANNNAIKNKGPII